jgi:hypothetical protein
MSLHFWERHGYSSPAAFPECFRKTMLSTSKPSCPLINQPQVLKFMKVRARHEHSGRRGDKFPLARSSNLRSNIVTACTNKGR